MCAGRHEKRNDCTFQAVLISTAEELVQQVIDQYSLTACQRTDLEALIHDELSRYLGDGQEEQTRQTKRISQLKKQRDKLLQAHYAGAIDLDQLAEEQQRISAELTTAHRHLAKAQTSQIDLESAITKALDLVENCAQTYKQADTAFKRELNQALFERIAIQHNGQTDTITATTTLTGGYKLLLSPTILSLAKRRATAIKNGIQNIENWLTQQWETIENTNTPSFKGQGVRMDWLVGDTGLEPVTPSTSWRCSSQLS